jgi:glycerophosphoryl diester phosphodiesterase
MLVLSHRGLGLGCPENTLEVFARALAQGADGFETDVRVGRDGRALLFHDRLTADGREVAALTAAELSAAVGYAVPTLDQALEELGGGFLWNLEIKTPATARPVLALVEKYRRTRRFLVTSFWHSLVEPFVRWPEVEGGLLLACRPATLEGVNGLFPRDGRIWTAMWNYETLDPEILERTAALGMRNFTYGVATAAEHEVCAGLALAGVISDRLDLAAGASRPAAAL